MSVVVPDAAKRTVADSISVFLNLTCPLNTAVLHCFGMGPKPVGSIVLPPADLISDAHTNEGAKLLRSVTFGRNDFRSAYGALGHLGKVLALLMTLTITTGCQIASGGSPDKCAGWKPVILTDVAIEAMSEDEAQDVLAHNEFGYENGCWEPFL